MESDPLYLFLLLLRSFIAQFSGNSLEKSKVWVQNLFPNNPCYLMLSFLDFFTLKVIFDRQIIALQCCVGFCHSASRISPKCTRVHSLWNLPYPVPPLGCHRVLRWAPYVYSDFPVALCFTYGNMYDAFWKHRKGIKEKQTSEWILKLCLFPGKI